MMRKSALLGGLAVAAAVAGTAVITSAWPPGPSVSVGRPVPVSVPVSSSTAKPVPVSVSASADSQVPVSDADLAPSPKTNDAGQSYGSALGQPPGEGPDLVSAYADDGHTLGYVYREELDAHEPQTLQEVLAWQKQHDPIVLKVYKSDGRTVVGKLTTDPGAPRRDL